MKRDQFLENLGYCKASLDEGLAHKAKMQLRSSDNTQYSIWGTSLEEIGLSGSGLLLYFLFIKHMTLCFFVMSILALPAILSNGFGKGVK